MSCPDESTTWLMICANGLLQLNSKIAPFCIIEMKWNPTTIVQEMIKQEFGIHLPIGQMMIHNMIGYKNETFDQQNAW